MNRATVKTFLKIPFLKKQACYMTATPIVCKSIAQDVSLTKLHVSVGAEMLT